MHQTDIDKILKYKDSPLSFSQISKEDFESIVLTDLKIKSPS